jgi:hypothetical protein
LGLERALVNGREGRNVVLVDGKVESLRRVLESKLAGESRTNAGLGLTSTDVGLGLV